MPAGRDRADLDYRRPADPSAVASRFGFGSPAGVLVGVPGFAGLERASQGRPPGRFTGGTVRTLGVSKLVVAVIAAAWLGGATFASATVASGRAAKIGGNRLVRIQVLSTRADLVSGGQALTQILLPRR